MDKPHYFHFATEGLKDDMLFCSVAEFIAGVNRIALCLIRLGKDKLVINNTLIADPNCSRKGR